MGTPAKGRACRIGQRAVAPDPAEYVAKVTRRGGISSARTGGAEAKRCVLYLPFAQQSCGDGTLFDGVPRLNVVFQCSRPAVESIANRFADSAEPGRHY